MTTMVKTSILAHH